MPNEPFFAILEQTKDYDGVYDYLGKGTTLEQAKHQLRLVRDAFQGKEQNGRVYDDKYALVQILIDGDDTIE